MMVDTRRFGTKDPTKHTQRAGLDWLQGHYPSDWPSAWSTVVAHRGACLVAALRALDEALSAPKITRQQLRRLRWDS